MNGQLLNGVLKEKEGFTGFVISDFDEINKLSYQGYPTTPFKLSSYDSPCMIFNAGVDMMMIANNIEGFITSILTCIDNGDISVDRIDDAVKRILAVKLAMGLVEVVHTSTVPLKKQDTFLVNNVAAAEAALKAA